MPHLNTLQCLYRNDFTWLGKIFYSNKASDKPHASINKNFFYIPISMKWLLALRLFYSPSGQTDFGVLAWIKQLLWVRLKSGISAFCLSVHFPFRFFILFFRPQDANFGNLLCVLGNFGHFPRAKKLCFARMNYLGKDDKISLTLK